MSDDFEAAWKKHVKVHSHNIPPTPCCLECREPWPCTVRLLLDKVRELGEEIGSYMFNEWNGADCGQPESAHRRK